VLPEEPYRFRKRRPGRDDIVDDDATLPGDRGEGAREGPGGRLAPAVLCREVDRESQPLLCGDEGRERDARERDTDDRLREFSRRTDGFPLSEVEEAPEHHHCHIGEEHPVAPDCRPVDMDVFWGLHAFLLGEQPGDRLH